MSLLCLKKLLWLEHLYIVFDLLGMIVNSEDEAYVYATRIGFTIPKKKKKRRYLKDVIRQLARVCVFKRRISSRS